MCLFLDAMKRRANMVLLDLSTPLCAILLAAHACPQIDSCLPDVCPFDIESYPAKWGFTLVYADDVHTCENRSGAYYSVICVNYESVIKLLLDVALRKM